LLIHSDTTNGSTVFTDSSGVEAGLGNDLSGEENHWTPTNLAATDVVLDSPTNNFATLNPLQKGGVTLSQGNLQHKASNAWASVLGTMNLNDGNAYYWEVCIKVAIHHTVLGIGTKDTDLNGTIYGGDTETCSIGSYSKTYKYGVTHKDPATAIMSTGNVIGFIFDSGTLKIYVNNVLEDTMTGLTDTDWFPYIASYYTTLQIVANFGQDSSFAGAKTAQGNVDDAGLGDFYYDRAEVEGALALCTQNLDDPAVIPSEHFNTVTWSGDNNATRSITGVGFQPDFIWLKGRSNNTVHHLQDVVRTFGIDKTLGSHTTSAEPLSDSTNYGSVGSVGSDGFTVAAGSVSGYTLHQVNLSGRTYVAWNWKANGSGSSNTDGSITSTVSANTDAGFSIVSYTATGTSSASVGHGLSKAPEMIIQKSRTTTNYWATYVPTINGTGSVKFNGTDAAHIGVWYWNNQNTTNSVFYVNNNHTNISGDDIAYCFHSVEGYSKVGSYTGNGSTDGTFVYTGFRPAYVMVKRTDAAGHDWQLYDVKRDPYNGMNHTLRANTSTPEQVNSSYPFDFTSNGFKLRVTWGDLNTSGGNYIFIAFAENPFKYTNAR